MTDYASLIAEDATPPTAQKTTNSYADIIAAEQSDRTTRRQQNVLGAMGTNPDQYALARQIEKHLAIPAEVADRNFPEAEKRLKINQMDHMLRNNPELARQMEDPTFARLSHDRAGEIGDILSGVSALKDYAGKGGRALASSLWSANSGLWGLGRAAADVVGTVLPDATAQEVSGWFAKYQQATGKTAKNMLGDQKQQGFVETSIYQGLQSLGQNLLTLPLALVPGGSAAVALGPMTAMTGGTEYGKARDKGISVPNALVYATSQAAIEYATEVMPVTKFLGDVKAGTSFAKMLMTQIAYEVPGEQVATLLQDLNEWAVINPNKPFSSYVEERPSAAAQTLIATIVGVGGQVSTLKGAEALINQFTGKDKSFATERIDAYRKVETAAKSEQNLNSLIAAAAQEPLLERAPDVFAKAINDAASEGQEVSEIHISARQLATVFNQDPIAAAEALGIDEETLDAALASNGDVSVSVGEFVTALAADEKMRPLVEHAKFAPGEMSAAEAREWESNQGDAFRQEAEEVLNKRKVETEFAQSAQQVEDFVLAEMAKAGRFTEAVNKADATLHKAFAVAMADRLGMLPMDFFKQHILRVTGESVAGGFAQGGALADVQQKWKEAGVDGAVSEKNGVITLSRIVVPDGARGGGKGSAAMQALIDYADSTGQHVALSPSADFGGNKKRLIQFYKRFGFVENKGKNRAFTTSESMYRQAQGKVLHQPRLTPEEILAQFDEEDSIELTAPKMTEQEIDDAERLFLSAFPKSVTTYRRKTGIARRLRRASDHAADTIGEDPRTTRTVESPLGPFSAYEVIGQVLEGDDAYNQGGVLKVKIYGKEQVEAGLMDEPALTFTVMRDGELSVNGPTPGGATFNEFQKRGWVEQSMAGDQIAQGWSNLVMPDGGKMLMPQLIPLLGDVHARVRAWRMEDHSGLHWARSTGALAALGDYGSAVFFQRTGVYTQGKKEKRDDYTLDLFDVPAAAGTVDAARSAGRRPAQRLSRDDAPGIYAARTELVQENTRQLGTDKVTTPDEAAQALAYLGKGAVERFDALITDKDGNPLAIVGAFKGALTQAAIYPATVAGEAFRVEGAANIWFAHNHPSGVNELSNADRQLNGMLADVFRGSGIKAHGLFAIAGKEGAGRNWVFEPISESRYRPEPDTRGVSSAPTAAASVPVVERVYTQEDRLGPPVTSPSVAKGLAKDLSGGKPGVLLLTSQNEPVAFVPVDPAEAGHLRTDGRMDALYRALSVSNAAAAILVNNGTMDVDTVQNLAGLFNSIDTRVLDVMDTSSDTVQSWAEQGKRFDDRSFNQGERGSFNPDTNTIALLQNADLSTFLHESGHYFLEVMTHVASQPDAPAQIRQDFDTLLTWFGVPATPEASALDTWAMMSLEEKRQYHEQFARGFEAYLYEGQAPSLELQGLFSRFRAWLITVYKSLAQLNVTLTDDVRAVMDRMVATDEQIAVAEAARRFAPIFQTAEQAGMTADEWGAYQAEHQQATDDAAADLEARSVRDMRWLTNAKSKKMKDLQKTAEALRNEVEIGVRAEVMAEPVYQAWQFLTGKVDKAKPKPKGDPKVLDATVDSLFVAIAKLGGIDRNEITGTWGTDPADIKALPRPVFGMPIVRANDGKSIDELVQRLGDYGYLPLDEHGKADVRDLEDVFAAEMRGDAHYSAQKDYADEMQQERPPADFDLENYPYGKLERGAVKFFYGSENEIAGHLDALNMLAVEGYQPDEVAEFFGFTSGDDMMRQLAAAESPDIVIEAATDLRMLEQFGDLSSPQAVERAAEKAIHNDVRARFLTRELNALRAATGKANVLLKAARGYAEQRIAGLKVKDAVKSAQHTAAESRSAKAANDAMKSGDTETAATHKRDQLLNHELARASIGAQSEVQTILRYLKRFDKESTRKALDADYRDQIDALLEKFDLRPSVSEKALAKRKSLADWIERQTELGIDPVVDERLINDTRLRHFREVTLEELRGLKDTVANIEHLGRLKNQLLTAQRNRNLAAVAAEITASIHKYGKKRKGSDPIGDPQGIEIVAKWGKQFAAMHRKFASIARQMDGMQDGGAMWDYFIRSMNDAGNTEADLRATMSEKLAQQFEKIKHVKLTRKEQIMPGVSLSRENMLVMALNWGNDGNRQRLLDGGLNDDVRQLTQKQVEGILDRLSKEEWDFVQGVWDMLEENRPLIAAQEKRLTGVEPKWVESSPIQTRHGTYRGGYYPAKYDGNFSTRSNELEAITDLRQQMQGAGNRAQTRKGYTQARASEVTGRPLKLGISTLTQHVNEVAHRLAWQDWLIDTNRLLKRNEIDSAIREHYGPTLLAEIRDTVRDIAVGDVAASNALERGLNHIRTGATIAGLGWNVTTSLLQPLGLTQSMVRIGWAPVARGLQSFVAHPLRTIETVEGKSKFMQYRGATMNREINDVINRVRNDRMSRIEGSFFYLIQTMQKVADMPTWLGRYEQALAAGESESRAIALADQSVIDAQGAGQLKDLAKIQRGSPALKLFTNFYSYFNTTYNLAVERGRATDFANPLAVGKLAVDYLMLFTVPAILGSLLKAGLKGDWEDDEEKLAKKLAKEQLNYLFGTMVLLREVGGAFTGNFGYEGPAGLRLFGALQKLVKQAEQGDVDKDLVKALINVGGVVGVPGVGQFPSGQVNRTIDGVVAVSEGKAGPTAVVFGAPPKK
jgi:GNAT superfamily N-acetyltransferase